MYANCLVEKSGHVVKCEHGQDHETVCKRKLNVKLSDFLYNKSGLRIMLHGEYLAVEHYKPLSAVQKAIVKKILKLHLIYELSTISKVQKSFRPIRSYNG